MTRFWITLTKGVEFVIGCMEKMHGGELFAPKCKSMKIIRLAKAIAPRCKIKYTGIRAGEKIHECLLTEDESRHALEFNDFFVISPEYPWWNYENYKTGAKLPDGFRYTSDTNSEWLSDEELHRMLKEL
jgi:UDP-N-acetylglucosamine 4,6-dehydratase